MIFDIIVIILFLVGCSAMVYGFWTVAGSANHGVSIKDQLRRRTTGRHNNHVRR